MDKLIIYLADLVHDYISKGPFVFPLNIGYISTYVKQHFKNVDIQLFRYPKDLIKALNTKTPDIVGLGNYTWNYDLNQQVCRYCKDLSNNIVTVCGGPDYPVSEQDEIKYIKTKPFLDFYVLHQGEIGFLNILNRFIECGGSIKHMKDRPIQNCSFWDMGLVKGDERHFTEQELNDVPSPYLTGEMDQFFEYNLIPIIETNRGCPYSCLFCSWGKSTQKRMLKFSIDRIKKDLEYISKKVKNTNLLTLGDSNFGIFERDVEIAKILRDIRDKTDYPRSIYCYFVKAFPERKIEIATILKDMTTMTASFQSMDDKVLKNIKRDNKANEFFLKHKDALPDGVLADSELILGLPGETKAADEFFKGKGVRIRKMQGGDKPRYVVK